MHSVQLLGVDGLGGETVISKYRRAGSSKLESSSLSFPSDMCARRSVRLDCSRSSYIRNARGTRAVMDAKFWCCQSTAQHGASVAEIDGRVAAELRLIPSKQSLAM